MQSLFDTADIHPAKRHHGTLSGGLFKVEGPFSTYLTAKKWVLPRPVIVVHMTDVSHKTVVVDWKAKDRPAQFFAFSYKWAWLVDIIVLLSSKRWD